MGVGEQHVGGGLAAALAPGPGHQDGARAGQFVGLADKVVLAAHAAEHAAVVELVGHRRAQQGDGEGGVDKARVPALGDAQCLAAVQVVDLVDPGHIDLAAGLVVQFAQPLVERAGAEKEAAVHDDAAFQAIAQPGFQGLAGVRVVQVIGHAVVVGQPQAVAFHREAVAQHAEIGELLELFRAQWRGNMATPQQPVDQVQAGLALGVLQAFPLQADPVVHRAPDDSVVDQPQQAVGHHLAAAVQAQLETTVAALPVDQVAVLLGQFQGVEQAPVVVVVLLAAAAVVHQGVAQGADADLQGAAVTDQGAGVQADEMVLQPHRHIGSAEQPGLGLGVVDHHVHLVVPVAQFRVVFHERQIMVYLPHRHDGLAGFAAGLQHGQQFQGHFRVAGKTVAAGIALAAYRQQLGHHVNAPGVDVAGGVGVVDADVMALGGFTVEQAARLEEEFVDADVVRQRVLAHRRQVIQLFVITEYPVGERFQEAPLQIAAGGGPAQGQGGVNIQGQARVRLHAPVQGVHQPVGLAQPQRQTQTDLATGQLDNAIRGLVGIVH